MSTSFHTLITPEQCRMARGALQITVRELAAAAGVTANTVTRFENEQTKGYAATIMALAKALQERGIEFIPATDSTGAGVRFSKTKEEKKEAGGLNHLSERLAKRGF